MKYLLLMSVAALSVGLAGCGSSSTSAAGDSSAPLCLDTAKPFEYPVSTFVVTEQERLERSSSGDYLQAIQYVSGGGTNLSPAEIQTAIILMEDKIREVAVYDGIAADGITSLNNAIDTMEEVVAAEDTAGNIQNGKIQMEGAIRDGVTCSYNNQAAFLRDESNIDPNTNLLRYILSYSYNSGTNLLARVIVYYTETTEKDPVTGIETTHKDFLATSSSALDPDKFLTSGYNAPLSTEVQWGDSVSTVTIEKSYQERIDRADYVSDTAFTVGSNTEVKRLKISINYETAEAKLYTSNVITKNDPGYDVTDIDPEVPNSGTPPTPIETYTATFVDGR